MSQMIRVRATVNLPDLRAGEEALVDPGSAYIATLLKNGHLIRV